LGVQNAGNLDISRHAWSQLVRPLVPSSARGSDGGPLRFTDERTVPRCRLAAAFRSTECVAKPRCACLRSNTKNAEHACQRGHGFTTIPGKSECLIHSRSRYNRLSAHSSWISAVARDLQEHRGKSLVVAGDMQPAAVHKCRGAHSEEHHSPPYARSTVFRPRARPRRWVACRE